MGNDGKQRGQLAWVNAVGAPTGETSPVVENLLVDGFAAGGSRGAARRSSDKPGEDGASNAAARGADRAADQAGCCSGFRARQRNGDGTCDAGRRTDGTADAPREVTRLRPQ